MGIIKRLSIIVSILFLALTVLLPFGFRQSPTPNVSITKHFTQMDSSESMDENDCLDFKSGDLRDSCFQPDFAATLILRELWNDLIRVLPSYLSMDSHKIATVPAESKRFHKNPTSLSPPYSA